MINAASMRLSCAVLVAAAGTLSPVTAFANTYKLECAGPASERFYLQTETRNGGAWGTSFMADKRALTVQQQNWQIHYQTRWYNKIKAPGYLKRHSLNEAHCHQLGVIDGTPVVNKSYLKPNRSWFDSATLPDAFSLHMPEKNAPALYGQIVALHAEASEDHGFLVPRGGRLVYEIPLTSVAGQTKGKVVGVVQSISGDNGKSWTPLAVTTAAQIYELGKTTRAQPFAARRAWNGIPVSDDPCKQECR
ncbi:hypothetical protein F2P45_17255 [Massilia sp. CCM 8733]|uniref:Uncharacterized protein n=1 Tax=Massilia mucilaginosa TaxID=2609282 RepID=A0ABX0NUX5_9BURK|nr:hypothetical protein [Massilia mucilaginosa]NHZ90756.1 hypothetical protein [Massilia mucilaginosa]